MDGTLRKWTNYWNGWQPRWFVLDKTGILSYYQTQETVNEGCKGAINVSAAEITAHPSDPYRLDVVVPGEQHFFLKAAFPHERQEWLMALGSVKSCLNSEKASQLFLEEDSRKRKICELRLYCDLLVQQVHSIKAAVVDNAIPDVAKMDENTSLLGQTCDTFIQTLEECIQMNSPPSPFGYNNKCSGLKGPKQHGEKHGHPRFPILKHGNSSDPGFKHKSSSIKNGESHEIKENGFIQANTEAKLIEENRKIVQNGDKDKHLEHENSQQNLEISDVPHTFFGKLSSSFAHIRLEDDGSIPTVPFLEACTSLILIFDLLGSTAFAPVKMDVNGNIRKMTQKYETDPGRYPTLHRIVNTEIESGTTAVPNSATDALLWLKRGITFLREFISCFQEGESDLTECANKAYAKSLKKYHGWVVRGVFTIAAKSAPIRSDFLKSLHGDFEDTESDLYIRQLQTEVTEYLAGIDRCLRSLCLLYESKNLDNEECVTK